MATTRFELTPSKGLAIFADDHLIAHLPKDGITRDELHRFVVDGDEKAVTEALERLKGILANIE